MFLLWLLVYNITAVTTVLAEISECVDNYKNKSDETASTSSQTFCKQAPGLAKLICKRKR